MAIPAVLKYTWAAPCTAVGGIIGSLLCCFGASPRLVCGVLEVGFRNRRHPCASALLRLPFRGITFGHVVLAPTHECQAALRLHERVHVEQYERWGVFFFGLYAGSSLIQLLSGRRPYMDNYFEVEARQRGTRSNGPAGKA
jgi:hypothetical protein